MTLFPLKFITSIQVEDANKKGEVEEKPMEAKNQGDTASHGADPAQLPEGDKELKKKRRKDKKMQKGSEEVESKKTETLGDAEMSATTEKRVKKKDENEATNEGEVEPPAGEVETPIEEVKLKKKERKRRNRNETNGVGLEKTEATTVADTGATKNGKKRKRLENEVQLNRTETTGEEEKAKKRKRKASRDAPADREVNGEEEKKTSEENEVKLTVDGIEKKRKKRKRDEQKQ